ncbi:hypothetical protein BOX15_Mlig000594g5, partial [Macrostomum lignano]
ARPVADPWASSCFGEDEEPAAASADSDELYLLPRLEVERLCDSRLDPPLDASSTAQPSADSATASTAALLNRRRRLVRADSLILRDPQARHAIDMLAAVRRLRPLQRRQMKWRRQRLQQQRQAGLAAAPPPVASTDLFGGGGPPARPAVRAGAHRRSARPPAAWRHLRRGLSAPPAEQRGRHGAAGRLRHRLGRGAALAGSRARPVPVSGLPAHRRPAERQRLSRRPAQGAGRLRHHGGLAAAPLLRPPHHRRPAPGAGPTGRSARPAGAGNAFRRFGCSGGGSNRGGEGGAGGFGCGPGAVRLAHLAAVVYRIDLRSPQFAVHCFVTQYICIKYTGSAGVSQTAACVCGPIN